MKPLYSRQMRRCQSKSRSLPRLWLFTDERIAPAALLAAAGRLPRGGGIMFRHHATPAGERQALFEDFRAVARRRGLLLVLAGSARQAALWRADGYHARGDGRSVGAGRGRAPGRLIRTSPAHDAREIRAALHADLIFLSPVFPTRSHPGGRTLGRGRFTRLAALARQPVVALGGMNAARARSLGVAYGWAAIDAWVLGRRRAK